jgi:glycosyltransferase involved in cell wall biosynthesis
MKQSASPKVSVVMPVYNEEATVRAAIERVRAACGNEIELIVVNDGSTDATGEMLSSARHLVDRLLVHDVNQGKGTALRTGFAVATGDIVIIQDADLEYDPAEYPRLIQPIADGRADVVYGSRFMGGDSHRVLYFWHCVANKSLTLVSNMFTNLNLSDMETCYKAFRRELIQQLELRENGFGIEPELTAKIARAKARIYEVGISYSGRTYEEGKKISIRDAVWAFWCIVRYNLFP